MRTDPSLKSTAMTLVSGGKKHHNIFPERLFPLDISSSLFPSSHSLPLSQSLSLTPSYTSSFLSFHPCSTLAFFSNLCLSSLLPFLPPSLSIFVPLSSYPSFFPSLPPSLSPQHMMIHQALVLSVHSQTSGFDPSYQTQFHQLIQKKLCGNCRA